MDNTQLSFRLRALIFVCVFAVIIVLLIYSMRRTQTSSIESFTSGTSTNNYTNNQLSVLKDQIKKNLQTNYINIAVSLLKYTAESNSDTSTTITSILISGLSGSSDLNYEVGIRLLANNEFVNSSDMASNISTGMSVLSYDALYRYSVAGYLFRDANSSTVADQIRATREDDIDDAYEIGVKILGNCTSDTPCTLNSSVIASNLRTVLGESDDAYKIGVKLLGNCASVPCTLDSSVIAGNLDIVDSALDMNKYEIARDILLIDGANFVDGYEGASDDQQKIASNLSSVLNNVNDTASVGRLMLQDQGSVFKIGSGIPEISNDYEGMVTTTRNGDNYFKTEDLLFNGKMQSMINLANLLKNPSSYNADSINNIVFKEDLEDVSKPPFSPNEIAMAKKCKDVISNLCSVINDLQQCSKNFVMTVGFDTTSQFIANVRNENSNTRDFIGTSTTYIKQLNQHHRGSNNHNHDGESSHPSPPSGLNWFKSN